MKLTLVVLAAGMGSRYGGLKQIDSVGPSDEVIIDYSIFDAKQAGFTDVICIIRRDIEEEFHEKFGKKLQNLLDLKYVYQENNNLPEILRNANRTKPWGTTHAVFCCKDVINNPFVVINADDFYGKTSYKQLADFLKEKGENNKNEYAMVGFAIKNTITENGSVARGVCNVDENNYLTSIEELTHIEKDGDGAKYTKDGGKSWNKLSPDTSVSMNMWGFTTSFFNEVEAYLPIFAEESKDNLEKAELYIPSVIDHIIKNKLGSVKVIPNQDKWYGVTYKEDKEEVQKAIKEMVVDGKYKQNLWE